MVEMGDYAVKFATFIVERRRDLNAFDFAQIEFAKCIAHHFLGYGFECFWNAYTWHIAGNFT